MKALLDEFNVAFTSLEAEWSTAVINGTVTWSLLFDKLEEVSAGIDYGMVSQAVAIEND